MKYKTISEGVYQKAFSISEEDLEKLGNCECRYPATARIREAGNYHRVPTAAWVIYNSLPQEVKNIVSQPPKPFKGDQLPLAEVIVSLKYNIPNQHDRIRYIEYKDHNPMNCQRDNLVFDKPGRKNKY